MKEKDQASKLAYHKEHMHMYRVIDKIEHKTHFKPVVKGGEVWMIETEKD